MEPSQGEVPEKEPFTTIDDLVQKAEDLTSGLRKLSDYKHPLDVRRGTRTREGVMEMPDDVDSLTVKAGAKTYFFDIKETKDNKPYLVITESRFKGEGKQRERVSMSVFPEQAEEFGLAVSQMTARITE
jgi:hypothetical protein